MSRSLIVLLALVALVAGLLLFGLHATNQEVVRGQPAEVLPGRDGLPVVAVLRESGGTSVFGIRITSGTRYVEVRFLAPAGCSEQLRTGDAWPSPIARCAIASEIAGNVRGLGTSASGESLVGVEFEVSRRCFDHLLRVMAWPSTDRDCAQQSAHHEREQRARCQATTCVRRSSATRSAWKPSASSTSSVCSPSAGALRSCGGRPSNWAGADTNGSG